MLGVECAVDDDCPGTARCNAAFDDTGRFTGFCSSDCFVDDDCAGLGVDARCVLSVCLASCEGNADCDAAGGGLCLDVDEGGSGVCRKTAGPRCEREADCGAGESCAGLQGRDVGFFCLPSDVVGQDTGARCEENDLAYRSRPCGDDDDCGGGGATCELGLCAVPADALCSSSFCIDGVCSGPCAVDADCGAGQVCTVFAFGEQPVGLCEPRAGSLAPCEREADCENGEHCAVVNLGDSAARDTVCVAADPGDVDVGEGCSDDFSTVDVIEEFAGCVSNFCAVGFCRGLCVDDGDCGAGAVCERFVFGGAEVGACFDYSRCERSADCDADDRCFSFAVADGVDGVCQPQIEGTLEAGALCDPTAEFASASCFDDADCPGEGEVCEKITQLCRRISDTCENGCSDLDRRCTNRCVDDADCADHGVGARCEGVGVVVVDTTVIEGVCVERPDGTRFPCENNDGCSFGELCTAVADVTGVVSGVCLTEREDRGFAGDDCDSFGSPPCAGGLCLQTTTENSITFTCRDLCVDDGDCFGGGETCGVVADAFGAGQDARVCRPTP